MRLPNNLFSNRKGSARWSLGEAGGIPILLIVGIIGILGIMTIANLAPFKNSFLASLYPKDHSFASLSEPIQPSPTSGISNPIEPLQGDLNGNGVVDIFDYNQLVTTFGQTGSNLPADFNQNGRVDIFDFNTIVTNFGKKVN
jgi:hypothetical protein